MSSGNRKIFDDDMPVSPLSMDSGIEEDLIGVENEENSGPSIVTALVAAGVAILVGILAWHNVTAILTALTGFPNLTGFLNEFDSLIVN